MAKQEVMYQQCELKRFILDAEGKAIGHVNTVSWLPSKFAVPDKHLKLKNSAGEWEDDWVVTFVGSNAVPESVVQERKDDYRYQRDASDTYEWKKLDLSKLK